MYWNRSIPNRNGNRRDKVALRTTSIKIVKFKIIEIRTSCQYGGYFYYNENLSGRKKTLTGPHAGRGLDIADLVVAWAASKKRHHAVTFASL